jgi:DNA-binding HxlR family transcriptional regulator
MGKPARAHAAPIPGYCARYQNAVELVGRRWNGAIVRMLVGGPRRFAELASGIPDISDRMLSERLRELESAEIVVRTVIPDTPVRVEYALTERGRDLETAVLALAQWAERWLPDEPAEPDAAP